MELQLLLKASLSETMAADVAVTKELMHAASDGLTDVARSLVKAGADKDVTAQDGNIALVLACANGTWRLRAFCLTPVPARTEMPGVPETSHDGM